jgi:predicted DNA-binding protein
MSDEEKGINAEIRITNVPDKMKQNLYNIRKNMGVSESALLKPVIAKWISEQPDDLKREYKD